MLGQNHIRIYLRFVFAKATLWGGRPRGCVVGWWTFFEAHAWRSAMNVEDLYYSMAPDSCVLTL